MDEKTYTMTVPALAIEKPFLRAIEGGRKKWEFRTRALPVLKAYAVFRKDGGLLEVAGLAVFSMAVCASPRLVLRCAEMLETDPHFLPGVDRDWILRYAKGRPVWAHRVAVYVQWNPAVSITWEEPRTSKLTLIGRRDELKAEAERMSALLRVAAERA